MQTHTRTHLGWGQMRVHLRLIILHQTQSRGVKVDSLIHSLTHTRTQICSEIATRTVCHGRLHYMLHSRRYELCLGWPFQQHFIGGHWGFCQVYLLCNLHSGNSRKKNRRLQWIRDITEHFFFFPNPNMSSLQLSHHHNALLDSTYSITHTAQSKLRWL